MNKTQLLFLIILVEGYVVLACELLAIRELIPFVGSGTDVVSITISAVLLPLAVGYHWGGHAYKKQALSIRKILLKNMLWALAILTLGLSYAFMELFFSLLIKAGISHRLWQTAMYVSLFLVVPVFLLGQTVPLISNYFSRRKLSEITGKMLFFSTTGSFLGSVFSTLVLMTYIGVHYTVIITLTLLAALVLLLSKRPMRKELLFCAASVFILFWLNSPGTMQRSHIVSDNAYNTIRVFDRPQQEAKILDINRSNSSKISKDEKYMFPYWKYIENTFIAPISKPGNAPRDMLIIGAGGFTIGVNDTVNRYIYVDIDPDLKRIAEIHFLPDPLTPNKQSVTASARAFVHSDTKQYDFILLDAFTNIYSIPMECTTREFLLDVKKLLKPDGIVVANVIMDPRFGDAFSVRYDNTFASVFPSYSRQIIGTYAAWPGKISSNNVLYIYFHHGLADDNTVYTDDKNTYSLDRK